MEGQADKRLFRQQIICPGIDHREIAPTVLILIPVMREENPVDPDIEWRRHRPTHTVSGIPGGLDLIETGRSLQSGPLPTASYVR